MKKKCCYVIAGINFFILLKVNYIPTIFTAIFSLFCFKLNDLYKQTEPDIFIALLSSNLHQNTFSFFELHII
jgi:hypothetical protein